VIALEENSTIQDLLDEIFAKHGEKISHIFMDENRQIFSHIKVLLNDTIVNYPFNEKLQDEDQIHFLIALVGG